MAVNTDTKLTLIVMLTIYDLRSKAIKKVSALARVPLCVTLYIEK